MLDIMLPPIIQMWISFLKRIQMEPEPIAICSSWVVALLLYGIFLLAIQKC